MSAVVCSPPDLYDGGPAEPGLPWPAPETTGPGRLDRLRWALSDVRVLTWRTLARIATTPEQMLNVTVLPLVFVLLFSYVFGGAIILPGHGSYRDYLIAGIFAVNMGGTAQGAAIGLAVDLSTGLIDRFRSLPMSRATVIVGRTLADLLTTLVAPRLPWWPGWPWAGGFTPAWPTCSSHSCSRCSSLTPPRGPEHASAFSPGDRNRLRRWD